MESQMEIDTPEVVPVNDDPCSESKPVESSETELSSQVESTPQILPSSQTVPLDQSSSPEAITTNQESSQAIPSDEAPSSQAVALDQAASSQAVASSEVPPTQVVSATEVPSSKDEPSQISPLPGPSSEVTQPSLPSKMTNGPATKKQRLDYHSMSTGVYLDSTVVPILHLALVTLDRLRPADPVQYVIDFLLRHKAQYSKPKEQAAPNSSANQA